MSGLLEGLKVHLEFSKILIIVSFIAALITIMIYILFRKDRKYRMVKYIPGFILFIIGLVGFFSLGMSLPGVEEFNKVLIIVMTLVAGFIAMSTGLIIGIIEKK